MARETVTFTNPSGGPLQLAFEESGVSVRVRFEGVGRHPHWRSPADNRRFAAAVAAEMDLAGWRWPRPASSCTRAPTTSPRP
ncbi:MAG: hypothetical protein IPL19_08940 [Sandaracinaceae bacterium]|nr:hypothetical protein [Sandaracinaceae bacterium]